MSTINLSEDFDWFAVDASGAVALFATSGKGFLPPAVAEFHVMHETVAGGIEYPHWGTDQIWDDAAALGLFVFDWSSPAGPYNQVASPDSAAETTLATMIKRITHLPVFQTNFADSPQIDRLDQFQPSP